MRVGEVMRCAVDRVGGIAVGGERGRESGRGGRAAHPHGLRGQVRLQGPHAGDVADPGTHRPHVPAGAHRRAREPRSRRLLVRVGRCPPCRPALSVRCPCADHRDPAARARPRCAGLAARPRIGGLRRGDSSREGGHADPRPRTDRGARRGARPVAARSRGAGTPGVAGPRRRPRRRRAGPDRRAVGRAAAGQSRQRVAGPGVEAAPRPDGRRPGRHAPHPPGRVPARRRSVVRGRAALRRPGRRGPRGRRPRPGDGRPALPRGTGVVAGNPAGGVRGDEMGRAGGGSADRAAAGGPGGAHRRGAGRGPAHRGAQRARGHSPPPIRCTSHCTAA